MPGCDPDCAAQQGPAGGVELQGAPRAREGLRPLFGAVLGVHRRPLPASSRRTPRPSGALPWPGMATARRARLSIDERREQLVGLGVDIFSERPYDEVSIDDIAAAAGISKGLLYHYFAGKRGLYVEVVRAESERLREVTHTAGDDPTRAGLDAFLSYVDGRKQAWAALVRGGVG